MNERAYCKFGALTSHLHIIFLNVPAKTGGKEAVSIGLVC